VGGAPSCLGPELWARDNATRYSRPVDHRWATAQLQSFVTKIDRLAELDDQELIERIAAKQFGDTTTPESVADNLLALDPVMRDLMNAARPGFGDYGAPEDEASTHNSAHYWQLTVKPWALRAIGVHNLGADAHERMRPDSPDLVADQFHPWVWDAAAPMWEAGSTQEAVNAAARSVNARLRRKLGRHDVSEADLCRQAFTLKDPEPGRPRLRFPCDRTTDTWKSRQEGAMNFGAGCYMGIRNPAVHEDGLDLSDQVALEQLAAFSVLARWIDECAVETAT